MIEKCWSRNAEDFNYSSLEELVDTYDDLVVGDIVYYGDAVSPSVKDYVNIDQILDDIRQNAYDNVGECALDWPDLSDKEQDLFENVIADFIEKHSPINFYCVKNVQEYSLTAEDLGNV